MLIKEISKDNAPVIGGHFKGSVSFLRGF